MKLGMTVFALLVGMLALAPSANAQSLELRVGVGRGSNHSYNSHGSNHSYNNHSYNNHSYNNHGHNHGGWQRPSGVSIDFRFGTAPCYPTLPVYRDYRSYEYRPVYRDYRSYDYRPTSIQVSVSELVPSYDRYGRICGEVLSQRWVTAYRDDSLGGYVYVDRSGNRVLVRR